MTLELDKLSPDLEQMARAAAEMLSLIHISSTKMVWAGGSSSVFSKALKAAVESMWTSSMM